MTPSTPRLRPAVRGEATAFSDYATVTLARAVYAALSLGSVTFTTRLLDPSQFGALSLFFVISLMIVTAASAWTSAAVSRFGREELELRGRMSGTTVARAVFVLPALAISIPLMLALQAGGVLPAAFDRTLALLSVVYAAVWVLFDHVVYMLETWGRQKLSAVAIVVQQVVYVATLAGLYASGVHVSPAGVALLATAGMAVLAIVIGVIVAPVAVAAERPDRRRVRAMWLYSSPLIAFVVSQYVIRSVDILVLGTFSTAAAVGTYALAYQGYGAIQSLATATGPVFTPLFVSLKLAGREAAMRVFLNRIVPTLEFVAAAMAAMAMAPAFALVPKVFGPGFIGSRIPLVLLLGAGAVFFGASLLASVVVAFDRTRETAVINIAAAVANATLDVLLVGGLHAGTWAPAAATITSVMIIWAGYTWVAAGCLGVRAHPRVAWLLPLIVATVPLLVMRGPAAEVISFTAALTAAIIGFVYGSLFSPEDAGLVESLDMPAPARRLIVRLLQMSRA